MECLGDGPQRDVRPVVAGAVEHENDQLVVLPPSAREDLLSLISNTCLNPNSCMKRRIRTAGTHTRVPAEVSVVEGIANVIAELGGDLDHAHVGWVEHVVPESLET